MTIIEIRSYLELAYFLTGPMLVGIAFLALSQIKVARKQLEEQKNATKIMAKRDALRLTSEQIRDYGTRIIPILDVLDKKIQAENINFLKDCTVIIEKNQITVRPCTDSAEREKLLNIVIEFSTAINALEGFSAYFVSGVADEYVAYRSLATTYCNSVKDILPLLVLFNQDNRRFAATLELFGVWNTRMESEGLLKKKQELDHKLKGMGERTIPIVGES